MLLIDFPRFERLPGERTLSVGSEAVVRATAGLVALLEAPLSGCASTVGAGYQAPLTVPFGLAVTATLGALGESDPHQDRWMVRRAEIEYQSRARGDELLTAQAVVERVTEHDTFVAATARGSESGALLRASIRLIAMQGGRYAAIATSDLPPTPAIRSSARDVGRTSAQADAHAVSSRADEQPLLRLRPPRVLASGARTEVAFEPDVLRLLMHPIAGQSTPLGRRVHPLGGAPLGAALTTAFVAAGEPDPDRPARTRIRRADVIWLLPLPANAPCVARTRQTARKGTPSVIVDVIGADGRSVLNAAIDWIAA